MWVPITPKRPDFCGCPPCHLCFYWQDEGKPPESAIERMAFDLLGKKWVELTDDQRQELMEVNNSIHMQKISVIPDSSPPNSGMDDMDYMNRWLKQNKKVAAPPPPKLTLDQLADIEADKKKEKQKQKQKQKQNQEVPWESQQLIPPSFIEECLKKGFYSLAEITQQWEYQSSMLYRGRKYP